MKCPDCKKRMRCKDSRWDARRVTTYRRWRCECGKKLSTVETIIVPARHTKPAVTPGIAKPPKAPTVRRAPAAHRAPRPKSAFRDIYEEGSEDNYVQDLGIPGLGGRNIFGD